MKYRLATSCLALSTAFVTPAHADVTAADVLSNQQALYGAIGVSLSGDLSGETLSNPELNIILPQGVASMQVRGGDVSMADNGNGTVMISYPSPMNITVAGGAEGTSFSAELTMTHDGYSILASGDPGDITYESFGENLRVEVTDISIDDGMSSPPLQMDGFALISEWSGTSRVTEGNLVTYSSTSGIGETVADFTATIEGVVSRSVQSSEPVETVIAAALPVGGADLMNLSAALRDGMSVVIESTGGGSASEAVTMMDGQQMNSQTTNTGPQTFDLSFTEDGFAMNADASDFEMIMNEPMIFPGDLEFGIANVTANYDVPINASESAQDFRIATGMSGITLGDTIWNLFDPSGQLPRDPADITFDITGMGTSGIDLLDFAAMSQMFGPPPVQIDDVSIENLRIAAVGAEATAVGAMTFDWTDFNTIPGVPRPEGAVTINLNGANALMDRLVAMGLIPEDQLMMPRMMMGMFATPVGDDMLETVLEVNDQGHVLANGQRLQ